MNKVPGKIEISYVIVEIFERLLNIPKLPSIENIGILYNCGPGVRTFVRTSKIPLLSNLSYGLTHLCPTQTDGCLRFDSCLYNELP